MYKKIFILGLLLFLYSSRGYGETFELTPEKKTDIIILLKLTKVSELASQGKHLFSCDEIMRRIVLPLFGVAPNNFPIPH